MASELPTYMRLVKEIKPLEQRRNPKTKKDTFSLKQWWVANEAQIPS